MSNFVLPGHEITPDILTLSYERASAARYDVSGGCANIMDLIINATCEIKG
jgi:hypothetical protein